MDSFWNLPGTHSTHAESAPSNCRKLPGPQHKILEFDPEKECLVRSFFASHTGLQRIWYMFVAPENMESKVVTLLTFHADSG